MSAISRTVLREQVKDVLLQRIVSGELKPGERLVETRIASELGTSQAPVREALRDRDIYPAAFRHYLDLPEADDVDILAKIGFQLPRVPNRADRANRLWDKDQTWLLDQLGERHLPDADRFKLRVWQTALDHYRLFGIDDLEQARTYATPQFAELFGSFTTMTNRYGGPALLRTGR